MKEKFSMDFQCNYMEYVCLKNIQFKNVILILSRKNITLKDKLF